MKYVIVGGSIAAASAIKAIRENDPKGSITLVTEEKPFYYRPLIPLIIEGKIADADLFFPEDICASLTLRVVKDRAVSLDPVKKELILDAGGRLAYDKLLIASGSRPLLPDLPGAEKALILRTLQDAHNIKKAANGTKKTVILGGGFVGVKAGISLSKLGHHVTIVEKRSQILYPRLDQKSADIVQRRIEKRGIRVLTNDTIIEWLKEGLRLASGDRIESDLSILAIGVRPNTGWLEGAGLKIEQAVVVDEFLETCEKDCYAAGDMVQAPDLITNRSAVSVLWTNAVDMGKAAGTNMAGGKRRFPGLLSVFNATEIEGMPMISAGVVTNGEGEVFLDQRDDGYRKLIFRDDRLIGAILMGRLKNAGVYTHLIKTQTPLGNLKDKAIKGTLTYMDFVSRKIPFMSSSL